MEARSLDHCCHGETIRITYSECVFVALDMHKRVLVLYCHMWPVQLHNILSHYLINGTIFGKKDTLLNYKCGFYFLYNFCLKHFSFCEEFSYTL